MCESGTANTTIRSKLASNEREAGMVWTRITEGEDIQAKELIDQMGYLEALNWLRADEGRLSIDDKYTGARKRWAARLNGATLENDRRVIDKLGGFLLPSDTLWPLGLSALGPRSPLGLWFRGNIDVLASPSIAIVGTRDSSQYGTRIATDFAYELSRMGVAVVSGGAFGIDASAHMGALTAGGETVVVLAGGVDRPYPLRNEAIFQSVLESGGLIVSEVPPGSSPHRHRFLARNRIIAGMTRATLVVEAPYRSGAINTARHALEIGREVGAVPGPLTSVRSAGCHRLLRENATCITSVAEAVELLGYTPISAGVQTELDVTRSRMDGDDGGQSPHPISLRVRDALPVTRGSTLQKVAATAGLSIQETLGCLGRLEMEGIAESRDGKWRLAENRRRSPS